jgi:hypothetical protein
MESFLTGIIIYCLTGAAWSLETTIDFTGSLTIGSQPFASKPVDGIVFQGYSFLTGGPGSGSQSTVGNYSTFGDAQGAISDNGAALILSNAIENTQGDLALRSYTELSLSDNGSFEGNFSFRYGATHGIDWQVIYSNRTSSSLFPADLNRPENLGSSATPPSSCVLLLPCLNGSASIDFSTSSLINHDVSIASVRFFARNFSNDGPGTNYAVIDDIRFNRVPEVPEPSTYLLMILGLLGIGFVSRRRMG